MSSSSFPEIARPVLTFPGRVAKWVRAEYSAARVILEYGSGGSTVMAAEMPGKTIFSVESGADWARNMAAYLDTVRPSSPVSLHHVDIGPTGQWGVPTTTSAFRDYHRYALSVWDREDFVHPDLILIDGRFRAACAFAALMRCERPVRVLMDDYTNRPAYHIVERVIPKVETRGRMARFDVAPERLPRAHLTEIIGSFVCAD